jgi:16S rRNA (cytidine1402-2'-O)-methyltransferase
LYLGFLPQKKWRQTIIKKIIQSEYPVFIYESVHRIEKTLNQLEENGFEGKIFIIREISKMFEQKICWDISHIKHLIQQWELKLKGEFVMGIWNELTLN